MSTAKSDWRERFKRILIQHYNMVNGRARDNGEMCSRYEDEFLDKIEQEILKAQVEVLETARDIPGTNLYILEKLEELQSKLNNV